MHQKAHLLVIDHSESTIYSGRGFKKTAVIRSHVEIDDNVITKFLLQ